MVTAVLAVEVVAALVGVVLVALAHNYTEDAFCNLYCVVVVVVYDDTKTTITTCYIHVNSN